MDDKELDKQSKLLAIEVIKTTVDHTPDVGLNALVRALLSVAHVCKVPLEKVIAHLRWSSELRGEYDEETHTPPETGV